MKQYLILACTILFFHYSINAQWTDKSNNFTDSNHMPVSIAAGEQVNSFVIRSYPDSGFIVFWEDNRNTASTNTDIYAQKFNKSGKALWAANGIPVSNGANKQHLYSSTNLDNRNYSFAATDSTNGFYITYIDDSISGSATLPRIMLQHIKSDGSRIFGNTGYVIARSTASDNKYDVPQLIADGNKGFFIAFKRLISSFNGASSDVYVYCYRDEGGSLKQYGGGQMDLNAYLTPIGSCANYTIAYRDAYANDFMIYPDLQNGCNVVMALKENGAGTENNYIGFNRLIRVKKTTNTKLYALGNLDNKDYTYKKDSVVAFYRIMYTTYQWVCGDGGTGTGYNLQSNGFLKVGNYGLDVSFAQGTTLLTDGNINVDVITSNIRRYINNTLTNWYTQRFVNRSEQFDNMPYEFKNYPYTPETYFNNTKPSLNTINGGTDTLLSNNSISAYNYCLKGSDNKIYAAALCGKLTYTRHDILLQQMQLNRTSSTSFALQYTDAGKKGVIVGADTAGITYYDPQIAVDAKGNAVFYMPDYSTFIRVSPIINGTQLEWGANGRAAGSGAYANSRYYSAAPFMLMDPTNGTSMMTWQDGRNYNGFNANNIMMRHFDKLLNANYYPPYQAVQSAGGSTISIDLLGSTKRYTLIELFNNFNPSSPAAEILDSYNLGLTRGVAFQNVSTIRRYNGIAYLNRNINLQTEQNITAQIKITMRIFFTTADFNALKAADASVKTPADLVVIQQPSTSLYAPISYAPTGQEKNFAVKSYTTVKNGYYIQAVFTSFTGYKNYYIFPASGVTAALTTNAFAKAATANSKDFITRLYPVPVTNNTLFIEAGNAAVKNILVEVIAEDGKTVLQQRLPYQSQSVNLNNVANGTYHVRITSGSLMYSGNIVKQSN